MPYKMDLEHQWQNIISNQIERSGLGRDGNIGDYYNILTETVLSIGMFSKVETVVQTLQSTSVERVDSDHLLEKLRKMKIDNEMKISLLCELTTPPCSLRSFLLEDLYNSKQHTVRCSLIYILATKSQEICHKGLKLNILNHHTSSVSPTHMIHKIVWGGQIVVTIEAENQKELEAMVTCFQELLSSQQQTETDNLNTTSLTMYATCLKKPFHTKNVYKLIKKFIQIKNNIETHKEGFEKPLKLYLLQIRDVLSLFGKHFIDNLNFKTLSQDALQENINKLIKMLEFKEKNENLYTSTLGNGKYLSQIEWEKIQDMYEEIGKCLQQVCTTTQHDLQEYRSGKKHIFSSKITAIDHFNQKHNQWQIILDKINICKTFEENKGVFVGEGTDLESEYINDEEAFVLFISCQFLPTKLFNKQLEHIWFLMNIQESKYIICDLDSLNQKSHEPCIWYTRRDNILTKDYLGDMQLGYNFVFYKNTPRTISTKESWVDLKIRCPETSCQSQSSIWHCLKCKKQIKYDCKKYFHCVCSEGRVSKWLFKCNNVEHTSFISYNKQELKKGLLKLKPKKEINILLLGPSGVGKSTWINSIVNYLTYNSLEQAEKNQLIVHIPACFTVTDDNFKTQIVQIGQNDDHNENLHPGSSATQNPKTYCVNYEDKKIRIIDTPGIGDTRGLNIDQSNVNNIIDHISHLTHLHGVVILLKPNETRLGPFFKFCVKELLVNLHKSACKNIIFCFTNARSTFYRAGETMPVLQELLTTIDASIPLNQDTVYYLDNESFRFLCTLKYPNISYADEKEAFKTSWERSVNEMKRLIEQVEGLEPHRVNDTNQVCKARSFIMNVTKPMAEIYKNIEINKATINDIKEQIERGEKTIEELEKEIYIQERVIVHRKLATPRTVCTNISCVDYMPFNDGVRRIIYKTHCHESCKRKVAADTYPMAQLKRCSAMEGGFFKKKTCKKCGCAWDFHMHVTYEQEVQIQQVRDVNKENEIKGKTDAKFSKKMHVSRLEARIVELTKEQAKITEISAKFGQFLKLNAIVPYNDSMKEYLYFLIKEEREKVNKSQKEEEVLKGLEEMLIRYEEQVELLEKSNKVQTADINTLVQELHNLPNNGQQLKRSMEVAVEANETAMNYSEIFIDISS